MSHHHHHHGGAAAAAPPAQNKVYSEEAQKLRDAMKGWFTSDGPLIAIIGNLNDYDINPLIEAYSRDLGRSLVDDIKSDTHGHVHDTLLALLQHPIEFDARTVHKAVKGLFTDDGPLIETICTRTADELKELGVEYKRIIEHELEDDIRDNTHGDLQKLLLHRIRASEEKGSLDEDVEHLYKAGQGKFIGHDDSVFINILAHRSKEYLHQLNTAYSNKHGKSLGAVIEHEMSGDLKRAFIAIVTPPAEYFAQRLHDAMKGIGTDNNALTRIIASQRFRHLTEINDVYVDRHGKPLKQAIADDTSFDFKKLLIAVIEHVVEGKTH